MNSKTKNRFKIIGIIIIAVGFMSGIPGLFGSIIFFVSSNDFGIKYFYQHPICNLIVRLLLILSGILLIKRKKISIPLTMISSILIGLIFISASGKHGDFEFDETTNKLLSGAIFGFYILVWGAIVFLIILLTKMRKHL